MKYNDLIPEFLVSNLETSKRFYMDYLGFQLEYERPEENFVFLSLGGIQLMLEQGSQEELREMSYPFGKGVNFSFGVTNIDTIYARLKQVNYPIHRQIQKRSFRVGDKLETQTEFAVLDPDGYYIRISD